MEWVSRRYWSCRSIRQFKSSIDKSPNVRFNSFLLPTRVNTTSYLFCFLLNSSWFCTTNAIPDAMQPGHPPPGIMRHTSVSLLKVAPVSLKHCMHCCVNSSVFSWQLQNSSAMKKTYIICLAMQNGLIIYLKTFEIDILLVLIVDGDGYAFFAQMHIRGRPLM